MSAAVATEFTTVIDLLALVSCCCALPPPWLLVHYGFESIRIYGDCGQFVGCISCIGELHIGKDSYPSAWISCWRLSNQGVH